jgi:hypothetical protein
MDFVQLLNDFNIPYYTEGYKYCRPGWINIDCPFCTGNPGPHLGYEIDSDHFNCWRCGHHWGKEVIAKTLNVTEKEAYFIIKQYGGQSYQKAAEPKIVIRKESFKLPSFSKPIAKNHRDYLIKRNFDPDEIEMTWGILGTGPISSLISEKKTIDYRFRLIIPFYWDDKMVSFDSRDITGKHIAKYMACPKERELIEHKKILYGKQSAWGETGICVEGPIDVWRFGVNSFATSGIEYTPAQVRIIAKQFKRVAVCYDGPSGTSQEAQAENKAKDLIAELKFRNVDAFRVKFDGDPGEMKQSEANYLVKQIVK